MGAAPRTRSARRADRAAAAGPRGRGEPGGRAAQARRAPPPSDGRQPRGRGTPRAGATPGAARRPGPGGTRCVADAADGYRSVGSSVTGGPALRADAAVGQQRPELCCGTRADPSVLRRARSRRRRRAPWRSLPCSSVVSPGPCWPPSSSRAGSTPCSTPSRGCRRPPRCWRRPRRACRTRSRPSPTSWSRSTRVQDHRRDAAGGQQGPAARVAGPGRHPGADDRRGSPVLGEVRPGGEGGRPAAVPQEPQHPRRPHARRGRTEGKPSLGWRGRRAARKLAEKTSDLTDHTEGTGDKVRQTLTDSVDVAIGKFAA